MPTAAKKQETPALAVLPLNKIIAGDNPRTAFNEEDLDALAASIQQHGVLQPIRVQAAPKGKFAIIAGERRVRAAKLAGLTEIPAYIGTPAEGAARVESVVENVVRADLNVVEEGDAYLSMLQGGETIASVAKLVSRPEGRVSDRIAVASLPAISRDAVVAGTLGLSSARMLAALVAENAPGVRDLAAALTYAGINGGIQPGLIGHDLGRAIGELRRFDPTTTTRPCPTCRAIGEQPFDADGKLIPVTVDVDGNPDEPDEAVEWRPCPDCDEGTITETVEGDSPMPPWFAVAVSSHTYGASDFGRYDLDRLPDKPRKAVEKLGSEAQAEWEKKRAKDPYLSRPPAPCLVGDGLADACVNGGFGFRIEGGHTSATYCTDPAWAGEYLVSAFTDAVKAWREPPSHRSGSNAAKAAKGDVDAAEQERKAKARKALTAARVGAETMNESLGRTLATKLGEVPVTADNLRPLIEAILYDSHTSSYGGGDPQAGPSLYYRFTEDGDKAKNGTRKYPRKTDARKLAAKRLKAELAAAKTPEQLLGVLYRLAGTTLAVTTGLPYSDREGATVGGGFTKVAARAEKLLPAPTRKALTAASKGWQEAHDAVYAAPKPDPDPDGVVGSGGQDGYDHEAEDASMDDEHAEGGDDQ